MSTAVGRLSLLPTILRALLPMTSKADKLSMDTGPVASDNNTIFMLKLGDQTFFPPYSTDNRSNYYCQGMKNLFRSTCAGSIACFKMVFYSGYKPPWM